jgi:hypothetical protein
MDCSNLTSAYKRAKHFANVEFAGPFTVAEKQGAAVAAKNYCLLLDEGDSLSDDLVLLDMWANSINQYCDNNRIADDETAKACMASFLSRMWLDPTKLG